MYSLTVLDTKVLKSKCGQGWFILEAPRENLFLIFPACKFCPGTSLLVRPLRLRFQCRGHRVDIWSGNWDPTCRTAKNKKTTLSEFLGSRPLHHINPTCFSDHMSFASFEPLASLFQGPLWWRRAQLEKTHAPTPHSSTCYLHTRWAETEAESSLCYPDTELMLGDRALGWSRRE